MCSIPNENSDQISDHLRSVIVPKWTQLCSSAVARPPSLPPHSPQPLPLSLSPTPVVLSALLLPLSVRSAHGPPSGSATAWNLCPPALHSQPPAQFSTHPVIHFSPAQFPIPSPSPAVTCLCFEFLITPCTLSARQQMAHVTEWLVNIFEYLSRG